MDVRRPALVRHRARAFEAEAARTVGEDGRARWRACTHRACSPARGVPGLWRAAGSRRRARRPSGHVPCRSRLAVAAPLGRTAQPRPTPWRTSWRGRSRDSGTRDHENERPEREADCDEPSHTLRSNRCCWRCLGPNRPSRSPRRRDAARARRTRPCRPPAPERRDAGRASCRATPRPPRRVQARRCRPTSRPRR